MVNHMASLGHADPGPSCHNLPRDLVRSEFAVLCRSLGIEPGDTWVLEVSQEGVLQFTRPLTEAEKAKFVKPGD
jgi:hypothetical protein